MSEAINTLVQQLLAAVVREAIPHVVAGAQAAAVPQPAQPAAQQFAAQPQPATVAYTPPAQPAAAAGGFFGAPAAAAAPAVTPDMVQALITPLVQNEQIKAALTAQMQAMGINNLPETTPAQLPELYARFQEVERQARAAGLIGAPAAAAPSII